MGIIDTCRTHELHQMKTTDFDELVKPSDSKTRRNLI